MDFQKIYFNLIRKLSEFKIMEFMRQRMHGTFI